eukprot:7228443-Ditylum_brightwellii.AAC.1
MAESFVNLLVNGGVQVHTLVRQEPKQLGFVAAKNAPSYFCRILPHVHGTFSPYCRQRLCCTHQYYAYKIHDTCNTNVNWHLYDIAEELVFSY